MSAGFARVAERQVDAQQDRRRVRLAFKRLVGGETTFAYIERNVFVRDVRTVTEAGGD